MEVDNFWDKYAFAIDGSHFNFKGKYDEEISSKEMDKEDVETFKKVIAEIAEELDIVIEPYFCPKYEYWLAGMNEYKCAKIEELMEKKGMIYE